MIKKQPKESLATQIADVLNVVPAQFDPEDDNIDDTRAKLSQFEDFDNEGSDNDEVLITTFRKINADLLADVDAKYAGKKGSRKNFQEDSSYEFSGPGTSDEDDWKTNSEAVVDSKTHLSQEYEESLSEGEQSGSEDEKASDDELISLSNENSSNFQHLRETNFSQQVRKGICVRNQMSIWENLLEIRIQMQKCLVSANRLPQMEHYKEMIKDDDSKKITETAGVLSSVLDKFLLLQKVVIKKYPETEEINKILTNTKPDVDEQVLSDTDEDEIQEEEEIQPIRFKRKLIDYEKDISELHGKYKRFRNDTIEKWNTKTRLSVTKNLGHTHSVVNQIEHIISNDQDKLKKRTQLKRSEYKILGQDNNGYNILESNEDNGDVKQSEEYNTEIFDDDDFYQQLLRELIEVKSADITDPVQLGKQWIQLQNLRSKMKRKIDTRATKGRKIRYAVHTKLVNFMAPKDEQFWTEKAKDELYTSLFGKIQPKEI